MKTFNYFFDFRNMAIEHFTYLINQFHELKGPQPLSMPSNVKLTAEQRTLIEDALTDERLISCKTYREQCYIFCSLLHDTDYPDDKPAVSYDIIG